MSIMTRTKAAREMAFTFDKLSLLRFHLHNEIAPATIKGTKIMATYLKLMVHTNFSLKQNWI